MSYRFGESLVYIFQFRVFVSAGDFMVADMWCSNIFDNISTSSQPRQNVSKSTYNPTDALSLTLTSLQDLHFHPYFPTLEVHNHFRT